MPNSIAQFVPHRSFLNKRGPVDQVRAVLLPVGDERSSTIKIGGPSAAAAPTYGPVATAGGAELSVPLPDQSAVLHNDLARKLGQEYNRAPINEGVLDAGR